MKFEKFKYLNGQYSIIGNLFIKIYIPSVCMQGMVPERYMNVCTFILYYIIYRIVYCHCQLSVVSVYFYMPFPLYIALSVYPLK
mgnify:CR=1 FL=1